MNATYPSGAQRMRDAGVVIEKMFPGMGFALLVFEFHKPGMGNYVSNANRKEMIECLEETAERFRKDQISQTPEEN